MNSTALMLDHVETIPVEEIRVENRLRSIDPAHAALIAESLTANGLMQPIEVRRDDEGGFVLIAGAHRLAAAKLAGFGEISAIIVQVDEDTARLREIDENLCRRDLTELDRATFLAERKAVWTRMFPQTAVPGRKKLKTNLSLFPTFAQEVAERLGLSPRSVDRAISRNDAIADDVKAMLAHTKWADNGSVLDGLGKLNGPAWPKGMQRKVAEALTREDDPARNLAAAIAEFAPHKKGSQADEQRQLFNRLTTAWKNASRATKDHFIDFLVAEGEIGGER